MRTFTESASFDYRVCDNGTTNGISDVKCSIGTVTVTVVSVNDAPTLAAIGDMTVFLGNSLGFTASATDIDLPADTLTFSLSGTVPAGAAINPATGAFSWTPAAAQAGQIYTLTVRVTDAGGLSAERSFKVGVAYTWTNLLAPIDADGGSVFNAGRTVPVKFQLTGASQTVTNATAKLWLVKITNGVPGTRFAATSSGNSNTGNLFRSDGDGKYIFNLSTKGLSEGIYQLQVDLGDGVSRTVSITLN